MLALLFLAAACTQEPALLPAAPEGWRFERLDFPLDFAPDIELPGFEELRFAPGMFEPDSPSFFSYALALSIADDVEVDEPFLRSFLESYYRGLCRSVGESRGLQLDLEGFAVGVEPAAEGFTARIDLVEPFVTAKPLALRLELFVQPGARSTEILGLASPAADGSEIWNVLRSFATSWRSARPAPVLLNHLYVVPDAETYAAVADCAFLREQFAVSEQRDTKRRDISYSGVYFYGERTYFELLRPDASAGFAPGGTGLGFGLERPGSSPGLAASLAEAGVNTFPAEVTRALGDEQLPWFHMLGIEQASATTLLSLFTLEYDPRFLERWHGDLAPATGGIERAAVLERYAASLGKSELREEAPFADVDEVRLALDEPARERLLEVCRTSGWIVEPQDGAWVCDGPRVTLVVHASDGPGGITGFTLRLRRAVEHAPLQLGRCRVAFEGATARLDFAL